MKFRRSPFLSLALLAMILPGSDAGAQVILGRLLDGESVQPIPWGFIELLDPASQQVAFTYSDKEGGFTLTAPGSGQYLVQAGAFSYYTIQDGPIQLGPSDTVGVEFFISPDPEELDPLVVEAKRLEWHLRTSGFYRRQERGMGEFITRGEIDDLRPHDISSLLVWETLGVLLRPNPEGTLVPAFGAGRAGTTFSGIGWCNPMYFLDGLPLMENGEDINVLVHPNDVAAVEVYPSPAVTPARFRDSRARCGTILIWTRREEDSES